MQLNADFTRRATVHAASLPWVASPMQGVERRMLDRIGGEVARATSLVRYAPGSAFSAHTHGGGEEFLVLDGVFADEHGDFPAGCYVRNPPGTSHTPRSAAGCVIFVKLWQFDPADRTQLRCDTACLPFLPAPGRPGVAVKDVFRDAHEQVRLERWEASARVRLPGADGGMEMLVLEGSFHESREAFVRHSWLRLPDGVALDAVAGPSGCTLWLKTGRAPLPESFPPNE